MSRTPFHVVRLKIPKSSLAWARAKLLYDEACLGLQKEKAGADEMILKAYYVAETPLLELLEFVGEKFPEVTEIEGTTIGSENRSHWH